MQTNCLLMRVSTYKLYTSQPDLILLTMKTGGIMGLVVLSNQNIKSIAFSFQSFNSISSELCNINLKMHN